MTSPVLVSIMLLIVTVMNNVNGAALQNSETERNNSVNSKRKTRNAVKYDHQLWPGGRLPYAFANGFSSSEIQMVEKAMREIESLTCIRFVRRSGNDKDYIVFHREGGCTSYIGRIGGPQRLTLGPGCLNSRLTVLHELLHAVGFYHEQNRQDRDKYVNINWHNIQEAYKHAYGKKDTRILAPFDYNSIMMYGERDFVKNGGKAMEAKDRRKSIKGLYGQSGLSSTDVSEVNQLYKCNNRVQNPNRWRTFRRVYTFRRG